MVPDSEPAFVGNANIVDNESLALKFDSTGKPNGKLDGDVRPNANFQSNDANFKRLLLVDDDLSSKLAIIDNDATNSIGINCSSGSVESEASEIHETDDDCVATAYHSTAAGSDKEIGVVDDSRSNEFSKAISPTRVRTNSLFAETSPTRPQFPPYGSDAAIEVRKLTADRGTQAYDWEFPRPKRKKRTETLRKDSDVSSLSAMVQGDAHSKEIASSSKTFGRLSSYTPVDILPQQILFSPFEIPPRPLGRSKEPMVCVSSVERLIHSRPVKDVDRKNLAFPLPPYRLKPEPKRSHPECARHKPFVGVRKSRNWFAFLSHPSRTDVWSVVRRSTGSGSTDQDDLVRPKRLGRPSQRAPTKYEQFQTHPAALRLRKSTVHGIGVFAGEDIAVGQYIIEYKGEVIRNCLVERREKFYRSQGLGSYMFAVDRRFTIDGTMKGCIARFINHSCDPNCTAKVITCKEKKKHIILSAGRKISKGEELSYDYKMPKDKDKIPCLCNSANCRKYLN